MQLPDKGIPEGTDPAKKARMKVLSQRLNPEGKAPPAFTQHMQHKQHVAHLNHVQHVRNKK